MADTLTRIYTEMMLQAAIFLVLFFGIHRTPAPRADFARDVRPILERRCQPCHFAGGKMYERLPFDRPETIVKLGTKLFTRIRNEDDRRAINRFLAAQRH